MEDKLNFQLRHLWLILKQNHLAMDPWLLETQDINFLERTGWR